jgi:hypothetical protein
MKKWRLWAYVLLATVAVLLPATTGGKVDAAKPLHWGGIDPALAPEMEATPRGRQHVIVKVALPSGWRSAKTINLANLTWDILMWRNLIWDNFTLDNLIREIVKGDSAEQAANVDWDSIANLGQRTEE